MSTFGTGTTTTSGSSIILTTFKGTNGVQAGTDGLVPGPAPAQAGYLLGASGDWTLEVLGGINLNDSTNRVATTQFVQQVVAGAVLGGNANLGALQDVDTATNGGLADDQFLQYNAGTLKWENTTLTLGLISDIDLAGLADGDVLVWDGNAGKWVADAVAGAGGGASDLNDLTDVTIAGVGANHFLVNNGAGQFVNRVISTADLSDSANIALLNAAQTFSGDAVFTADVDLTGAVTDVVTQGAGNNTTLAASTAFVQQEITALNLGTASQSDVGDFLASNASVDDLSDVNLAGVADGNVLTWNAGAGEFQPTAPAVTYTDEEARNASGTALATGTHTGISFVNNDPANTIDAVVSLAGFSVDDLSDVDTTTNAPNAGEVLKWDGNNFVPASDTGKTQEEIEDIVGGMVSGNTETGISVVYQDNGAGAGKLDFVVDNTVVGFLAGVQTFTGDKTFTGAVDLTGATATASLQVGGTNDTSIATTSFVQQEITTLNLGTASQSNVGDFLASNSGLDDLSDVTLNLPVAGHLLVHDGADFKNRVIASSDLSDTANIALLSANQTFTGDVRATTQLASDNSTLLATTEYADRQVSDSITALNLGTASQSNVGDFLASNASVDDLSDVTLGVTGAGQFLVHDGVDFKNRVVSTADLTDVADIAFLNAPAFVGVPTAPTAGAGTSTTQIATTEFVQNELADYQPLDATLTSLSALGTGADKIAYTTAQDTWAEADLSANARTFLGSDVEVGDLTDVTLGGVALANGQALIYDNGTWVNSSDVALLSANQTFTGNVDFTGGAYTADNPANNAVGREIATASFVRNVIAAVGNVSQLDDLADVTIGGVALAQGQVLAYTGNNVFENVALASTQLSDTADLLRNTSSINDLADVNTAGVADGNVLTWNNVAGEFQVSAPAQTYTDEEARNAAGTALAGGNHTGISFVNNDAGDTIDATVSLASTDLTDTANIARLNQVQTFSANATFTANVDLTGAIATATTQNANDNSTNVATTAYVDAQIDADILALNLGATYQAIDASLDTITGIVDGDLLLGNGADTFEKVNVTAGVEALLKSDGNVGDLADVSVANPADKHFLVHNGAGSFANRTISTGDLSDEATIALTTRATTFGAFAYNFEAGTLTSATPALATNNTTVATTEWVNDVMLAAGNVTSLNDLDDVLTAGVVNAQILVYDADGGANDNQWKNVSLSGDISISNAGVATIGNDKITTVKILDGNVTEGKIGAGAVTEVKLANNAVTTVKILDGNVTNAKLANSEVTIGSTAISLGATSTTLGGMTSIDFTNADATIGASMTTNLGNPTTLTLGGAGSKVVVTGDLQVNGDTTTVSTTNLDVSDQIISLNNGVAGANADDIGLFLDRGTSDPALIFWDEGDTSFKVATHTGAVDSSASDFSSVAGLTLASLQASTPAQGDDSNLVSTTAWVNDYFQPLDATLTALAGIATQADKLIYADGADSFVTTDLPAFGRTLIANANAGDARTDLGLVIGTDVQGYDATLQSISALGTGANKLIYTTAQDTWAEADLSAFSRTLLDDADAQTARATLGLTIGTDVQAQDATLQSISQLGTGADKLIYTTGVDTWAEATLTAFSRTLLDDVDAQSARNTLGLGTSATLPDNTFVQVANNLNDLADKAVSRQNLGVEIGVDVQAYDATLNALAGVNTVADRLIYATGVDTFSITTFTAFSRTLLDDADAQTARATLGLTIGTNVQAQDATLQSISALGTGADKLIYTTGVDTWAETTLTAFSRGLLDDVDAPTARATLGLTIGTDVQAQDATLQSISALGTGADKLAYTTGVDTWAETTLSAFSRDLLDDANALTARATLGLTIGTDVQAQDATLQSISQLGTGAGKYLYTTGVDTWAEGDISTFAQTLLDDADAQTARATLGLTIGTDVQAQDATLQSISQLGTGADKIAYTTAQDTWAEATLTAFSRDLLDDADAQSARNTLGLGTSAVEPVGTFAQVNNNLSDLADAVLARANLGLGSVATLDTTVNGGVADAGNAIVTDAQGNLGALDGSNLTALGSIGTLSDVDLTGLQDNQGLVYNVVTENFEVGTIPTTGTDVGETPTITAQSISLNPNALVGGDLVIYGRVMEVIDYGSVADAFGAGDFALDFGGDLADPVIYSAEDYGVLVP